MSKSKSVTIQVRIPEDLANELKHAAERDSRSMSNAVRLAVQKYVAYIQKTKGKENTN